MLVLLIPLALRLSVGRVNKLADSFDFNAYLVNSTALNADWAQSTDLNADMIDLTVLNTDHLQIQQT